MKIKTVTCNHCNSKVELISTWVNECECCGTEYSIDGGELAPRSEWGWETGESF